VLVRQLVSRCHLEVVICKVVHHSLPLASVVLAPAIAPLPEIRMVLVGSIGQSMRHMAYGLCDVAAVAFVSCKRTGFLERVQGFCLNSVQNLKQALLREDPEMKEGVKMYSASG
jgi:hypothetical protein